MPLQFYSPCEHWHREIKNRKLESNSYNPNSNFYLHRRAENEWWWDWALLNLFRISFSALRNVDIFGVQMEEARLFWLCSFNIQFFMMKVIIEESYDVSMHSKIALNSKTNVHKTCISSFHCSIYILFMSALRKI